MAFLIKFSPGYPGAHNDHIQLLNRLNKVEELIHVSEKALNAGVVCKAFVYNLMGLSQEKNGNYPEAIKNFEKELKYAGDKYDMEEFEECIDRIKNKQKQKQKFA